MQVNYLSCQLIADGDPAFLHLYDQVLTERAYYAHLRADAEAKVFKMFFDLAASTCFFDDLRFPDFCINQWHHRVPPVRFG